MKGFVAALGAILAVAIFANGLFHADWFLSEPDLWWHIKTGQHMIDTGAVLQTDVFSHSQAGKPWIAKEWLAQVLYALGYATSGFGGALILACGSVALAAWLVYTRAARDLHPFLAVLLAVLGNFFDIGINVARPHVFTFPIAIALTYTCFDAAREKRSPPWWSLLLIVLWTNLHASFTLAFLIAGCAFIDFLQRARLSDKATALKWLVYLALAVGVTLINPYGYKPYQVALSLADGIDVMRNISEWAPFTLPRYTIVEVGLVLWLVPLLYARPRLTLGQIAFILISLHMMFLHVRFIYLLFLLVPMILLPELATAVPKISRQAWASRARDGLETLLEKRSAVFVSLAALAGVALAALGTQTRPPAEVAVPGAIAYIKAHEATSPALKMNVFNDYNYGGPLILAGIKTYVDGRADQLFSGKFIRTYLDSGLPEGTEELNAIIADPKIGWTIFPKGDPRNITLATLPQWQKTYGDDVSEIYERRL